MPVWLAWSAVQGFLGSAWTFLTTPPWSYVALAAALSLGLWGFGQREFNAGKASCQRVHVEYVTREVVRQQVVVKTVVADSDAQTNQHKAQDAGNHETVRIIHVHDKALPDAAAVCVDPDDADRLRGLK